MKKYLIGLDLDGTLLNNLSQITETTKHYLQKLQKEGHKIVLATGRPYRGTINFYNELELNTPLIVDNGASIFAENDSSFTTLKKRISKETIKEIFKFSKDFVLNAFFSIQNDLYVFNKSAELTFFYHYNNDTIIHEVPFDDELIPDGSSVIFLIKTTHQEAFTNHITTNYPNDISINCWRSNDLWTIYELLPANTSKGTALNALQKHYNINKENTISFGDNFNDCELLKESGIAVKMKNGSNRLSDYFNQITEYTNNEDGVIKHLKRIIRLK